MAIPASAGVGDPERRFKEALTLNGQDVASLYLKVLSSAARRGYMKYRTVPVFPQVGDKINRAIERIATKQRSARDAHEPGAGRPSRTIKKAGIKIDL